MAMADSTATENVIMLGEEVRCVAVAFGIAIKINLLWVKLHSDSDS